jgi:hypothetical protein
MWQKAGIQCIRRKRSLQHINDCIEIKDLLMQWTMMAVPEFCMKNLWCLLKSLVSVNINTWIILVISTVQHRWGRHRRVPVTKSDIVQTTSGDLERSFLVCDIWCQSPGSKSM